MGPVPRWYVENGLDYKETPYAGGRIDVYGLNSEEFYKGKTELSLPIMREEDYYVFSDWLESFHSEELMSLKQIINLYEKDNPKIRWFNQEELHE
jgi:spore coat polysaccharide biosynthesis protein SpsF (cytidylyltransferase family)